MIALLPTKSSQTSLLPSFSQTEEARLFDGIGHTYITQATLVHAYGKGIAGRAKCPLCKGLHLSVTQDGRFNCFKCGETKALYWQFRADGLLAPPHKDKLSYLYSKGYFSSPSPSSKTSLACKTTLDTVYRALLSLCPLTPLHQTYLRERGFSFDSKEMMLCSLPDGRGKEGAAKRTSLVMALLEKTGLSRDEIACVSGFYLDKKKKLQLGGTGGLLLPVFDTFGRIVGMQIRSMRKSTKIRYTWLSAKKQGGISGGAPVGFLPKSMGCKVVDIVEGFFKAAALRGQALESKGMLYMPGVGMLAGLLERLDELEGVEKARIWFDADSYTNPNVLKALGNVIRSLRSCGLEVEVKGWDIAKGKGIDDYLANGHEIAEVRSLPPNGVLRAAEVRKSTANLISSGKVGRLTVPILPDVAAIFADKLSLTKAQMYENTEKAMAWALRSPMGTLVLHDGPTGSGKSRAALLQSGEGTLYVVDNYKLLFEIAKECKALGIEVQILYGRGDRVREDADLETQARQMQIWEAAGCENIEKARELGERGYPSCQGCPLFEKKQGDGKTPACRYWQQREEAVKKAGKTLTLTLIQTLTSNHDLIGELGGQLDTEGKGGVNTVIFDDIKDLMSHLSRPQDVTVGDVRQWEAEIAKKDHKGAEAYRGLIKALREVLEEEKEKRSPAHLERLMKAGRRARDAFDQEERFFTLFKPEGDKRPPLNALESLAFWLSDGESISFRGEGEERSLRFLRPSPLVSKLSKNRVIYLDATPDRASMSWLAAALGMKYKETNLPQPTQNIVQLPELLWTEEQLAKNPIAKALHDYVVSHGGFILGKKALASDGDAYFGRDERGLNSHQDAPMTLLAGHHMMSAEQAGQAAWLYRAFAHHRKTPLPWKEKPEGGEGQLLAYGDPWRPWKRKQHVLPDPLAEQIRRHHYSATLLQGAARDRDPEKVKFVLAGSPIELNGKPYPVSLCTLNEMKEYLEAQGFPVLEESKEKPGHISRMNDARKEKKEERILEKVASLRKENPASELNSLSAVRDLLGGKSSCRGSFAKAVWEQIQAQCRFEENQGLTSKTIGGHTESLIKQEDSVCPPCVFESDSVSVCPPCFLESGVDGSTEDTHFPWYLFGDGEEAWETRRESRDELEVYEGDEEADFGGDEEVILKGGGEAAFELAEDVCEEEGEEMPFGVKEGMLAERCVVQLAFEAPPLEKREHVCEAETPLEGQEGVFGAREGAGEEVALAEPEEPLRAFVSCDEGRALDATKKGAETAREAPKDSEEGGGRVKAEKEAQKAFRRLPVKERRKANKPTLPLTRIANSSANTCDVLYSNEQWRDFGQ